MPAGTASLMSCAQSRTVARRRGERPARQATVALASLLTRTVRPCEHRTVAVRWWFIHAWPGSARRCDSRSEIIEFAKKPIAERQVCILRIVE